jgi:hypothetical protein
MGGSILVEAKRLDMKKAPATRLGHAVSAFVAGDQTSPMIGKEKHSTNNSLRDVILGGQDGLVNMLGIALGVVAAGGSTHVLVVTGIGGNHGINLDGGGSLYILWFGPRLLSRRKSSRAK